MNKYSTNGEDFNEDSLEEAAELSFDQGHCKDGDIILIFEGDAVTPDVRSLVPQIAEEMSDQAYEITGEPSYFGLDEAEAQSLQKEVNATVLKWCKEHNTMPDFWTVENVKEIKVRVLSDDDGSFKCVEEI